MVVPPIFISFRLGFFPINHPAIGVPPFQATPIIWSLLASFFPVSGDDRKGAKRGPRPRFVAGMVEGAEGLLENIGAPYYGRQSQWKGQFELAYTHLIGLATRNLINLEET